MPSPLQFDRINGVWLQTVNPHYRRYGVVLPIPGGRAQAFTQGSDSPSFDVQCEIAGECDPEIIANQFRELIDNPDITVHYAVFPEGYDEFSGFYNLEGFDLTRDYQDNFSVFPINFSLRRLGTLQSLRWATYWTAGAETYTGWTQGTITAHRMVSSPIGVSNLQATSPLTRVTSEGSLQVQHDPVRNLILYQTSPLFEQLYRGECKIYDTVTGGNTNEALWIQVLSSAHEFDGDVVFQNELLRYVVTKATGIGTFYVWDTISTVNAWLAVGQFKTALTGNLDAPIVHLELLRLTPEIVTWREIRQANTGDPIQVTYSMRRGSYFCKVTLQTFTLGISTPTYVRLYSGSNSTQYFHFIFNSQTQTATPSSDLATSNNIYHGAWVAGRNVIEGFFLLDQPSQQPFGVDVAGYDLAQSNTWATADEHSFFIFAIPALASGVNFANARTTVEVVAPEALYDVEQKLILVPRGWYI